LGRVPHYTDRGRKVKFRMNPRKEPGAETELSAISLKWYDLQHFFAHAAKLPDRIKIINADTGDVMTTVADLLNRKGAAIVSILPSETIENAAKLLTDKRIGALVVRDRRGKLGGILSERDVVRAIAFRGTAALADRVEDLMTREVRTCKPTETVKGLMEMMTLRRHRHVPVCDDAGELMGLVSIGDAVKARLDEQASEVAVLRDLTLARS
jgi:CBS domain-containing protein